MEEMSKQAENIRKAESAMGLLPPFAMLGGELLQAKYIARLGISLQKISRTVPAMAFQCRRTIMDSAGTYKMLTANESRRMDASHH